MKNIWMIISLSIIWCGFSNNFTSLNILLGISISSLCCFLVPNRKNILYHIRIFPLLYLLFFVTIELIKSSLIVAWEVLTPKHSSHPKTIEIKLDCEYDFEKTLLTTLISLTPGTLSIDLTQDKSHLKVHVMFGKNPSETIDYIKNHLEPKVRRVFNYANV